MSKKNFIQARKVALLRGDILRTAARLKLLKKMEKQELAKLNKMLDNG